MLLSVLLQQAIQPFEVFWVLQKPLYFIYSCLAGINCLRGIGSSCQSMFDIVEMMETFGTWALTNSGMEGAPLCIAPMTAQWRACRRPQQKAKLWRLEHLSLRAFRL